MRHPGVLAAIDIELRRVLHGELAPLALGIVRRILTAPKGEYSERVTLDAARLTLDRAGFVPPKQRDSSQDREKQPEEMSTEELHALVDRLEKEMSERATLVEPTGTQQDDQLADLL